MIEEYYRHIEKTEYDLRLQSFLNKIINISELSPRNQYLYPLMDDIAFKNLEAAMMMTIENFVEDASNDNKK